MVSRQYEVRWLALDEGVERTAVVEADPTAALEAGAEALRATEVRPGVWEYRESEGVFEVTPEAVEHLGAALLAGLDDGGDVYSSWCAAWPATQVEPDGKAGDR